MISPGATLEIPRIPWDQFLPSFYANWNQGEHVTVVAPTGIGKTHLMKHCVGRRSAVVIFVTKPRDPTLAELKKRGYRVIRKWGDRRESDRKLLLWPSANRLDAREGQAAVFREAYQHIYEHGGRWCIVADDSYYLCKMLRLTNELETIWVNGRSVLISQWANIQRPTFVPLVAYDQATHLFFGRDNDDANLKRIGGIGWLDSKLIRVTVAQLPKHDLLYICSRSGDMAITRVA